METLIGSVITFLVLAFLIVFLSGEVHPRNQTIKVWLLTGLAIPVGFLLLAGIVEIIY